MTLKNRQVVEDVIHFRKIVLSPDWNNNVLNQYYLNNTATRNLFPAEFAAQAVAHMVLHGNYAGIESYSEHIGEERFDLALAAYLRYLRTAESIFIALKDKNVLPYIKNAVGRIVDLGLLVNIPVLSFVKEGANKRGNSSRLTQSFHFFMFEPIFSPVNALNQPI